MTTHTAKATCWVLGAALVSACSLTVPSEGDLFGGKAGSAAGGLTGESGSQNTAGHDEAGTGGAKAGAGGSAPTNGGSGGDAGESVLPEAGAAGEGTPELPAAALLLRYTFDDVSDFVAKDSSGNKNDGALFGLSLPGGAAGHIGGALKLDGPQKQYVQMPNDLLDGVSGISIASWIKLGQALAWDRLFDFNSGESNWWFFSPTGWNDNTKTFGTRSAARTPSVLAPEIMMTQTVAIGDWHHLTVVFAKPYLRYYLDGELQTEITNMSFGPESLGKTAQNWIGRSVYAADPYLSALVDDFRVYTGALTAEQVAELAAQ